VLVLLILELEELDDEHLGLYGTLDRLPHSPALLNGFAVCYPRHDLTRAEPTSGSGPAVRLAAEVAFPRAGWMGCD
jgi:hypothetical protein